MATAAFSSAVRRAPPPVWLKPRPCSPASSGSSGGPRASAPPTGCPWPPAPWAGSPDLSAWWVRLGIFPEGIEPGKPQQHGRHERRHRTLQADTTRPPARTRRAQPRTCDRVRAECNGQRPHEALDMPPPPHATTPPPVRCPTACHRLTTPTVSRGATAVPTGASGGPSLGSWCTDLPWRRYRP